MNYKTIRDIKLSGKTVLVRVDYNVPLENGEVVSDLRIRASLPTLEFLRAGGAKKIILISHLGRPEGRDKSLSLKPVAETLRKLLPEVSFIDDVSGPDVESAVRKIKKGGILLLENLRFFNGEEKNSSEFIREIIDSTGANLFVQDGFAVAHREHASTVAVADHLPVYAGLLLEKEIINLQSVLVQPARPLLVIIGGAKVADKKPLITNFLQIADHIAIGGKISADYADLSSTDKANFLDSKVLKSAKVYLATDFDEDASGTKLDIGPVATSKITELIGEAKTIIWNGLLGKAEDPAYSAASTIVAEAIGEHPEKKTIICGGDTTGFVENLLLDHPNLSYSLISTGGGATLEFLAGNSLPGLSVIEPKA